MEQGRAGRGDLNGTLGLGKTVCVKTIKWGGLPGPGPGGRGLGTAREKKLPGGSEEDCLRQMDSYKTEASKESYACCGTACPLGWCI